MIDQSVGETSDEWLPNGKRYYKNQYLFSLASALLPIAIVGK